MKKTILKEYVDAWSMISNFLGDTALQIAGSADVLGDPVIIAALVTNYYQINGTLDRFEQLKSNLLGSEMDMNFDNLKSEMYDIREDLEVDIIDTLQRLLELTPTSVFGSAASFASGLPPLLTKLTIEDIVDKLNKVIPEDLDVPLVGTMTDALYAILFIDNILKVKDELQPLHDDPEVFTKELFEKRMVQEGRKKTGTKLCSRGKSAAKAKFDVYPSAYANGYAIQVCKGKIKGLDGKRRCSPPYC